MYIHSLWSKNIVSHPPTYSSIEEALHFQWLGGRLVSGHGSCLLPLTSRRGQKVRGWCHNESTISVANTSNIVGRWAQTELIVGTCKGLCQCLANLFPGYVTSLIPRPHTLTWRRYEASESLKLGDVASPWVYPVPLTSSPDSSCSLDLFSPLLNSSPDPSSPLFSSPSSLLLLLSFLSSSLLSFLSFSSSPSSLSTPPFLVLYDNLI